MAPTDALLESLSGALASSSAGVGGLSDAALCHHLDAVEQLGRLVDALRVTAAAEVDARSGRELGDASLSRRHSCPTGAVLVEQITRVSAAEASRRVRVGRALAPRITLTGEVLPAEFPLVADAVVSGRIGVDAAAAVIRHLNEASRTATVEQLAIAEAHLVVAAESQTADLVAVQARAWRERLDPDGAEPREEELRRQRRFVVGREVNGLTPFSGLADPVNAALLRAAIAERTAPSRMPRFFDARDLEAHDLVAEAGADSRDDAPLDPRLREQRAFDVVFGLLTAGIRAGQAVVGSLHGTATVTAVIRAEDLARGTGVAWIDDVLSPIATATTHELICDGGIRLQIEGAKGEILWEGYRERYFTPPQRRALGVRDGGCVWPSCTAPPSWCHAHHVIEWKHGGRTDVDNGALMCSFHHHLLHASEYRLRMVDGLPELQRPFGDREWIPVGKSRVRLALTA
jgi:hypothetical protein